MVQKAQTIREKNWVFLFSLQKKGIFFGGKTQKYPQTAE